MFVGKQRCLIRCGILRTLVSKRDQTLQDSGKRTPAYRVDGMIDRFQTRYSFQDHRRDDPGGVCSWTYFDTSTRITPPFHHHMCELGR